MDKQKMKTKSTGNLLILNNYYFLFSPVAFNKPDFLKILFLGLLREGELSQNIKAYEYMYYIRIFQVKRRSSIIDYRTSGPRHICIPI